MRNLFDQRRQDKWRDKQRQESLFEIPCLKINKLCQSCNNKQEFSDTVVHSTSTSTSYSCPSLWWSTYSECEYFSKAVKIGHCKYHMTKEEIRISGKSW